MTVLDQAIFQSYLERERFTAICKESIVLNDVSPCYRHLSISRNWHGSELVKTGCGLYAGKNGLHRKYTYSRNLLQS